MLESVCCRDFKANAFVYTFASNCNRNPKSVSNDYMYSSWWSTFGRKSQVLYFAEQLGCKDFKASVGFLDCFKERQGLMGQNLCGEEKSVDASILSTWEERLPDICCRYKPKD